MAESLNSLCKAEVIEQRSTWEGLAAVERATAEWVSWFNHERLHSMLGYSTPAEVEADYWANLADTDTTAA